MDKVQRTVYSKYSMQDVLVPRPSYNVLPVAGVSQPKTSKSGWKESVHATQVRR